jgi:hypothetical protein
VRMWVMSCSCGVRRLPGLGCVILSGAWAGWPGCAAPSEKALRDLRRRLGPAPFKALFEVVARPLAQPHTPAKAGNGLPTVVWVRNRLTRSKKPGNEICGCPASLRSVATSRPTIWNSPSCTAALPQVCENRLVRQGWVATVQPAPSSSKTAGPRQRDSKRNLRTQRRNYFSARKEMTRHLSGQWISPR